MSQCGLCGGWQVVNPLRKDTLLVKRLNTESRIVCDECENRILAFPIKDKDRVL